MQNHEYALLGGANRSKVGRYLGVIAASVSAGIVFLLLSAVNLAQRWGLPINLTPAVLSLVGAGAVFAALYASFDRFAWRWSCLGKFIKMPNLAGDWKLVGQTGNPDGPRLFHFVLMIHVFQPW